MSAYILNLFDLAFTLLALRRGAAELNPLMRCVPVMVCYKTLFMGAGMWWLSRRPERIARNGMNMLTAFYGAVNVWHIVNLA